jgi:hypothetical protein
MSYVRFAKKLGLVAMVVPMLALSAPVWTVTPALARAAAQQAVVETVAPSGAPSELMARAAAQEQQPMEETTDPSAPQKPAAPAMPVAQQPVEVTGSGKMVSKKFTLQGGLLTYHAVHSGSSNFIVYILDGATGAEVTSIVNEIGKVDATKAMELKKGGTYAIQVQADGDWKVTLEQPRPNEAPEGPQAYNGNGTSLSPFFHADGGLLVIGGTYQGDGRVAIRLRDANGQVVEQIANQVGTFTGSKGVSVTPGIYFLELYGKANCDQG